ncbi:MAG: hypothetical protein WC375_11705, partial [Methanomassiliicoccales archaeon]
YWHENVPNPNLADINRDNQVNFLDYAAFADLWLASVELYITAYNLETLESIDVNNLNGEVGICLNNTVLDTELISVYLDNLLVGEFQFGWDTSNEWISINTAKFLNGWHTLRIVSTDYSGNITNHKPIKVRFNNLLYNVSADEHFSPDNGYALSGFYAGSGSVSVDVKNMYSSTIWSNTYSGQYVNITVPGSAFGTENMANITISENSGSKMAAIAKSEISDPSPPTITEDYITRKFNPAYYPNLKAVIILPDPKVFNAKLSAVLACARAFQSKLTDSTTWAAMYYHDVTPGNLTDVLSRPSLKYIYWCGHANSHVGKDEKAEIPGVQRTNTQCWRHWNVSPREFEDPIYTKKGVFSYIGGLPGSWDQDGYDLWGIHLTSGPYMHDSANKKIVFVDGCLSGVYNDMAQAYGVYYGTSTMDQIYIGWNIEWTIHPLRFVDIFLSDTVNGTKMFWERMGTGSSPTNNVYAAFTYVQNQGGQRMRNAFFGVDGMFDGGIDDDNIRIYGRGGQNMSNIRIVP